jgi:nicotinate phosphoribosyltransferase
MAHSSIQAHDNEALAFEHFAHSHPQSLVLLIDNYDTVAHVRNPYPLRHQARRQLNDPPGGA